VLKNVFISCLHWIEIISFKLVRRCQLHLSFCAKYLNSHIHTFNQVSKNGHVAIYVSLAGPVATNVASKEILLDTAALTQF